MHDANPLPEPPAAALAHSRRLAALIRERIDAADGAIDFAEYMDLALNAPGLGYYSAGAQKFGADGDFVTAPEISPIFSNCVGRAIATLRIDGRPPATIIELGAGTGAMAVAILGTLARLDALPDRYLILEVSADLRARQRAWLSARAPHLVNRIAWLDRVPDSPVDGMIIANEVVDALPVSRFGIDRAGQPHAHVVEATNGGFGWGRRPPNAQMRAIHERYGADWPPGYATEYCPSLPGLIGTLASALGTGIMLLADYGMPAADYYRPDRAAGTLACHYRHRVHDDPFVFPGLQDITAWVDFTALARAASAGGLDVLGFTTQSRFLVENGLEDEYAAATRNGSADERWRLSAQLQTLMLPGQMGEHCKVIALGREATPQAFDFGAADLRHRL